MPIGQVTRGTTGTNRLRRVDRWIAQLAALRHATDPLVVDLGYGASATTTLELHQRLARVRADVEVLGLEIEPERVRVAAASARPGVSFALGGFEVPLPGGRRATVIRALNVLRQYEESEVLDAWWLMVSRLQPGGVLVEGTCNEVGRVASWVDATAAGPRTLTVALRLAGLEKPSIVAERLPKVLIHRNVPGEAVHAYLAALDQHDRVALRRELVGRDGPGDAGPDHDHVEVWLRAFGHVGRRHWSAAVIAGTRAYRSPTRQ